MDENKEVTVTVILDIDPHITARYLFILEIGNMVQYSILSPYKKNIKKN